MSGAGGCKICKALDDATSLRELPKSFLLKSAGYARSPLGGSRLYRYSCENCHSEWMVELGDGDTPLDWFRADPLT